MASSMEAIVRGYAITVAVPLHRPIATPKRRDSHYWEDVFESYMNEECVSAYKNNFKKCRDLIRMAESFGGSLENVTHGSSGESCALELTFRFEYKEWLSHFESKISNI